MSDYAKYRGRCKELSKELCELNPDLRLVRGYYWCPIWGRQAHWWTEKSDGTIIDTTSRQFPSAGVGAYEEFDGKIDCEYCHRQVQEDDAYMVEHRAYCSDQCYARDIGF